MQIQVHVYLIVRVKTEAIHCACSVPDNFQNQRVNEEF